MVDVSTSHFLAAPRGFARSINSPPHLHDLHILGDDNEHQGKKNKNEKQKKKKKHQSLPIDSRNSVSTGLDSDGQDGGSEDTDADDEEDDEDDNNADSPADLSPVRVKSSNFNDDIDNFDLSGLTCDPFEHRTGLQDDDVFKTPVQRSKSEELSIVDSIDDLDSFDEDLFDEEIEKEEEMAIIQELEHSDIVTPRPRAVSPIEEDVNILSDIEFDEELAQDPDILWSISRAHFGDFGLYGMDYPHQQSGNPRTPPASPTPYGLKVSREAVDYFTDSASQTESDMDVEPLPQNPNLNLVNNDITFNWDDSEDSDEDNVWEADNFQTTDNEEQDNEESGDEAG